MRTQVNTWVEGSAKASQYFVREDFGVKIESLTITVTYQHQPNYSFRVELQHASERESYLIESSPGTVRARQTDKAVDAGGINSLLSGWMKRVKGTLELLPHFRALKDVSERQAVIEDAVKEFSDQHMTRAEFADFERRLREMEERLAEMASAQAADAAQAEEFQSKVHTAFATVLQRMDAMTPRSAVRLVLTQIFGILAKPDTPQKILAMTESVKALGAAVGVG